MTQAELFYNSLINFMEHFVNNDVVNESFSEQLGENEQTIFSDQLAIFRAELINLNNAKNNGLLYGDFPKLLLALNTLKSIPIPYTLPNYDEIFLIISIINVISDDSTLDLSSANNVNTNLFDLVSLDGTITIPQKFFIYENSISTNDSIMYFEKHDHLNLESNLRQYQLSLGFLFNILEKVGNNGSPLQNAKYAIIKIGHSAYKHRIIAFLLIHILSSGLEIHISKNYGNPLIDTFRNDIKIENKYQQFADTFNVISEYNSSKDILSKYLKIYQVVEDYMYKSKLVKLEKSLGGKIFKLRDFKKMNEEVAGSEKAVLKEFISQVFSLQYSAAQTVQRFCFQAWRNLSPNSLNNVQIVNLLTLFDVPPLSYPGTETIFKDQFSRLIYNVRNSIVHNKTTEFHLTYFTLSPEIYLLLEKFMIPTLEALVFFLTCKKSSNLVWFDKPNLEIWNDN